MAFIVFKWSLTHLRIFDHYCLKRHLCNILKTYDCSLSLLTCYSCCTLFHNFSYNISFVPSFQLLGYFCLNGHWIAAVTMNSPCVLTISHQSFRLLQSTFLSFNFKDKITFCYKRNKMSVKIKYTIWAAQWPLSSCNVLVIIKAPSTITLRVF